jgi:hypothetical protein
MKTATLGAAVALIISTPAFAQISDRERELVADAVVVCEQALMTFGPPARGAATVCENRIDKWKVLYAKKGHPIVSEMILVKMNIGTFAIQEQVGGRAKSAELEADIRKKLDAIKTALRN